ncbi:MAG: DUF4388 domain-containing protein [Nitrospirota bacterium]
MSSHKEKRTFKRYKYSSPLRLTAAEHSCSALTTDYSLKGIGFFLEKTPPGILGAPMHFTIDDLKMDEDGQIIWTETLGSGIRGGIERRAISGFLKHFPLGDLLMDLYRSRKTGLLDIRHEKSVKRIYLSQGEAAYATSNREEDRLFEILIKVGIITHDQYYQILHMAKKSAKSPSAAAIELGHLSREDLLSGIRRQTEEIAKSLFLWEDGRFVFVEGLEPPEKSSDLTLSTPNLVFQGIKQIRNRDLLSNAVFTGSDLMVHSASSPDLLQVVRLDAAEREILSLINGTRRLKEVLALAPCNEADTLRTLCALQCTGMLVSAEAEQELSREENGFYEKVRDLHARLAEMDYYSFLGIGKRATPEMIRKAYYQAVKELHPDRHHHLSSETVKNQLNMIFAHLTEVYRVLSNPAARLQYDQGLTIKPSSLQTSNEEMAKIKFREGKTQFRNGAYRRARELFEQTLYLDATVASYSYHLALTLEKENQYTEACKMLNQALKIEPLNADYLAELGHVYLHLGFRLRAKSTFDKALQASPSHKKALEGIRKLTD